MFFVLVRSHLQWLLCYHISLIISMYHRIDSNILSTKYIKGIIHVTVVAGSRSFTGTPAFSSETEDFWLHSQCFLSVRNQTH